MEDIIIIAVIVLIISLAGWYVWKARKSGRKCVGCPDGGSCSGSCGCGCSGGSSGCNCGCGDTQEK